MELRFQEGVPLVLEFIEYVRNADLRECFGIDIITLYYSFHELKRLERSMSHVHKM